MFVKDTEAHSNQELERQRRNVSGLQFPPQREALNVPKGYAQRPWDIL